VIGRREKGNSAAPNRVNHSVKIRILFLDVHWSREKGELPGSRACIPPITDEKGMLLVVAKTGRASHGGVSGKEKERVAKKGKSRARRSSWWPMLGTFLCFSVEVKGTRRPSRRFVLAWEGELLVRSSYCPGNTEWEFPPGRKKSELGQYGRKRGWSSFPYCNAAECLPRRS